MKIYFVSGFLGSGKTTSIINAGRILMAEGLKTGVVTNDQGKYLVDNYFVNASGIPSIEVANGCFCCNYDDFDSHLLDLAENEKPDIIFAESVGSCADIVATVMKPLNEFRANYSIQSSLTAFTDGRLLKARLSGGKLPFSDDVIYIFDKQIEESDILVINKSDLLSDADGAELLAEAKRRYPEKRVLLQSAFSDDNLSAWMTEADGFSSSALNKPSMDMDYARYASGELKMAWFDKIFSVKSSSEDIGEAIDYIFSSVGEVLNAEQQGVGHLKLFIKPAAYPAMKISLTGMDGSAKHQIKTKIGAEARVVLNARVETEPDKLSSIVNNIISSAADRYKLEVNTIEENSFRPGEPAPVHRFA